METKSTEKLIQRRLFINRTARNYVSENQVFQNCIVVPKELVITTQPFLAYRAHFSYPSSSFSPQLRFRLSTKPENISLRRFRLLQEIPPPMAATSNEDDLKYGFLRKEMYKTALKGTVDAYDRHVFLAYKGPTAWPAKVESSEDDALPKLFASAMKARKNDITVKTKVTVCGSGDGSGLEDGDVLLFPDMVVYRGLKESDVEGFIEDVIVRGESWSAGNKEEVTATYVFVCAHGSRDKRCGVCGPVLMEKLKEEIRTRDLGDQVIVSPCSHIGGHKYAGNLIIYGTGPSGKVTGHWYGYVTPDDVTELLDCHIGKGEIIEKLWRGQMGVFEEGGKDAEQKHQNGKEHKKEKKHKEEPKLVEKEAPSGCCQGPNGVSCCRDGSSEQRTKPAPSNKAFDKLSGWIKSFEQEDILAAAAVVGAVATVAIAYSFYRRST